MDEPTAEPLAADGSQRWFPAGRTPWVIVATGVVLRLAWATVGAREQRMLADPGIYYRAALRIADGSGYVSINGHPTAYYPPGYPWFLGSTQWMLERLGLGAHTVGAVAIVQSLLSALAIAAVMVVGNRLGGRRVAIAAGAVIALWPNLVVYSSLMLSETLFVTLLSLALAGIVTLRDHDRSDDDGGDGSGRFVWWRAVLAGGALGAATLVRPQVLLAAAAIVVGWVLCRLPWRDVAARTAVLVVGVMVVVAPWTIRNAIVFGELIPVSTNDGDNLCVGFNPEATGYFTMPESCDTGELYTDGPSAELRRQATTRDWALGYIRRHPGDLPELTWKKLWYTYRTDSDGVWASMSFGKDPWLTGWGRRAYDVVSTVYYAATMLAVIVGAVLAWRRSWSTRRAEPTAVVLVLGALASSAVPALFFGDPRFKVAAVPFYAVLAAVAVAALLNRWSGPDRRVAAAPDPATPQLDPSTPS